MNYAYTSHRWINTDCQKCGRCLCLTNETNRILLLLDELLFSTDFSDYYCCESMKLLLCERFVKFFLNNFEIVKYSCLGHQIWHSYYNCSNTKQKEKVFQNVTTKKKKLYIFKPKPILFPPQYVWNMKKAYAFSYRC